jgi:anti-anti-sigma regulatory factor
MISFKKVSDRVVELDFQGEITAADYKSVKPKIEEVMSQTGKVKFLMDLTDVKGFDLGAVYQDIKFDLEHFKNIGATAVIASKTNYALLVNAINLIYPEKVYHFEDQASAMNWLNGEAA